MLSPNMFIPKTASESARPGHNANCGSVCRYAWLELIKTPQDGTPGGRPKPRKLRPASARMLPPIPKVNIMISVGMMFGIICTSKMRTGEQPMASEAEI